MLPSGSPLSIDTNLSSAPVRQPAFTRESASLISVRSSVSADLVVVTAEGDRVTLSADADRAMTRGTLERHEGRGTGARVDQYASERSQSLAISVEGDLSREERRDLRRLLGSIKGIIKEAARGDIEGGLHRALAAGEKLGRLDSLAGFQLDVEVERELTVLRTEQAAGSAAGPRPPEPAPSAAGKVDDAAPEEAPAPQRTGEGESVLRQVLAAIRDASEPRVRASGIELAEHAAREAEDEAESDEERASVVGLRVELMRGFELVTASTSATTLIEGVATLA